MVVESVCMSVSVAEAEKLEWLIPIVTIIDLGVDETYRMLAVESIMDGFDHMLLDKVVVVVENTPQVIVMMTSVVDIPYVVDEGGLCAGRNSGANDRCAGCCRQCSLHAVRNLNNAIFGHRDFGGRYCSSVVDRMERCRL